MIERTFIQEGIRLVELEHYLKKELSNAGFTEVEVQKTPLVTRVIVNVTRPGLVIGKKGQNIKKLTKDIEEVFKIDNPQIEIKQIERPDVDSKAVIEKFVSLIGRGFSWRSVAYRTISDVMRAGAMGVELKLAGKLGGKGARKARKRIVEGYMKKVGNEAKLVDYAKGTANTKGGAIGVKLRIVRPGTVFKDKLTEEILMKGREKKAEENKETAAVAAVDNVIEEKPEAEKVVEEKKPEAAEALKEAEAGKENKTEKKAKHKKEESVEEKKEVKKDEA